MRTVALWNAPRNLGERAAIAREDATRARVDPATTFRVSWTKQRTKETVEFPSCAFMFIGPKTMFSIAGIWRYDRVAAWQKPIPIDPKWRSTFRGNATVSADGTLRLK
ncbi:MAG: hypothetical protein HY511_09970 [Actinobacteria bacterium]|nr:hypothetical protein [Actinomycetota bacterium]